MSDASNGQLLGVVLLARHGDRRGTSPFIEMTAEALKFGINRQ